MAVEEVSASPGPSDNPTWQRFLGRFKTKQVFGGLEIPDPDEIIAEAARIRQDPKAVANLDKLNDPKILLAIAGHLRTLIATAELIQSAKKDKSFGSNMEVDELLARTAYDDVLRIVTGKHTDKTL